MEQQQIEAADLAALQAALGGHRQVARILALIPQPAVGEARKAARTIALAGVEVVPDRADDAHLLSPPAGDRLSEDPVCLTLSVHVSADHGRDRVVGGDQRAVALVVERLAEVHEAPAAPSADGKRAGIERHGQLSLGSCS